MSMAEIVLRVNSQIDAQIRAVSIGLFSSIIKMTPVDTGRAKGNWQCTISNPATEVINRNGESAALSEVLSVVPQHAGHKVFLSNNLPYIERLEYGYSNQAPGGMVRISVDRFRNLL